MDSSKLLIQWIRSISMKKIVASVEFRTIGNRSKMGTVDAYNHDSKVLVAVKHKEARHSN